MSNHSTPSRLKGLSLAVAQVIAVTGAADAVAVACTNPVTAASPLVISSDVTGTVCSVDSGPSSVTLSSGVTLTAADNADTAVRIERGTVVLDDGASIVAETTGTAQGVYIKDESSSAPSTSSVTLGANTAITTAANSLQAKGGPTSAEAIHIYSEGGIAVDLGVDSSLTSASSSAYNAKGTGIFLKARNSSSHKSVVIGGQELTVSVSASVVESEYFAANDSSADGIGIESYGATTASIDLGASSITVDTSVDRKADQDGSAYSHGINVRTESNDPSTPSRTEIELKDTFVKADASIESEGADEGYGTAVARGVSAISYSDDADASVLVGVHGGAINVAASTALSSDAEEDSAKSSAISAQANSTSGQDAVSIVVDGGADITSSASGYAAVATGILSEYGNTDEVSIALNDASVEVRAEGYRVAASAGVAGSGDVVDISLNDAKVTVSAGAGSSAGQITASGVIAVGKDDVSVKMTNSSVTVNAVASAAATGPSKYVAGVTVSGSSETASVVLNSSSIVVNAPANLSGIGVRDTSEHGARIILDSGSRIEADMAVYSEGISAQTQLLNAGNIVGDIKVLQGSVDNSGTIIGRVGAKTLTVRDNGVVAGTADVQTLSVEAGGELQVILTDSVDRDSAQFTAVDATLADGSKVHLNATSDLYNPEIDVIDYLVLTADNSLIANTDEILLNTSGLINADWVECGALSLCVSVRALELKEIAINDGSSTNGVEAAGAAQSVLEQLSGSETADTFLNLIERVVDEEAWEELDGSGQGESLLASRDAERVVSRYVQRLMQQGRSSGEELPGAQGLWVQALQTDGDGDSDNGVAGFEVDTTGFAIGYDRELRPGLVVGGVISSADTEVESDDNLNRVDTDTVMASVYGQWSQGPLFTNAVVTYGRGDNDSRREVVGDIASADYDSDFLSLRIQGGKEFGYESGWKLSPRVEVAYNHVNIDSYDEAGTVAALSVGSQSYETIELGLGLEIAKPIIIEKAVWTPYFDLAVYHDFADDRVQSNSRFVIGGNSFVTSGSDVEQTNVSATLGLSYAVGAHHSLKAAYEYFGNSNYDSASWMLRYSYGF